MNDPRDLLPQLPWEGPPIPRGIGIPWKIIISREPPLAEAWMGEAFVHEPTEEEPEKYIWVGTSISPSRLPRILRHEIAHTRFRTKTSSFIIQREFEAIYYTMKHFEVRREEDLRTLFQTRRMWSSRENYRRVMEMEIEAAHLVEFPVVRELKGYPSGVEWI